MRANPEYLIPYEFGPAIEQLESVNTQKTNGLADLIPDLRLSVDAPGGSVDTAIEFLSEDEDDPKSLQNVRFPGVVRPRKKKQRPRHVDLANNPFDAVYVDPDRVPIGMEYPDRVDIPTAHRWYYCFSRGLYLSLGFAYALRRRLFELFSSSCPEIDAHAYWWYLVRTELHRRKDWQCEYCFRRGIRCRPETSTVNGKTTVTKATCKDCAEMKKPCSNRLHIASRLGALWSLPRYPVNEQTVWDLARRWGFIGVSPQLHLHQSLLNKNNKSSKEHLLQNEIQGNFADYVEAQQRLQAEDAGLRDIEYWTREVAEGRGDRYARLKGDYSGEKKRKSRKVGGKEDRPEEEASGSKVPTSSKKTPSTKKKVVPDPDVSESDRPVTRSRGKKAVSSKVEVNELDTEPLLTVRIPPQRSAIPQGGLAEKEDFDVAAPPPTRTIIEGNRIDRTRTTGRNRAERAYHRPYGKMAAGLAPTRFSTIPARRSRDGHSASGRRLVMSGVEVPSAPYSIHEAGLPFSRPDPVVSSPPASSFGQPRLLFLPSPDPETDYGAANVIPESSDDPSQGDSQPISGSSMPMMSEASASAPEDVEDIRSSVAPSDDLPDYESELTDFSDGDDAGSDLQYPGEPTAVNPPSSSNANMVGSPPGRGNRSASGPEPINGAESLEELTRIRSLERVIQDLQAQNEGLSAEARLADQWRRGNEALQGENARLTTRLRENERAFSDLQARGASSEAEIENLRLQVANLNAHVQGHIATHEGRRAEIDRLARARVHEFTTFEGMRFEPTDIPRVIRIAERNAMSSAWPLLNVLTVMGDHQGALFGRLQREVRQFEDRHRLVPIERNPNLPPAPEGRSPSSAMQEVVASAGILNSFLGRARQGFGSVMESTSRAHDAEFLAQHGSTQEHGLTQAWRISPNSWAPFMTEVADGLVPHGNVGAKRKEREDDTEGGSGQGPRKK
ncbi:hypothetical protein PQX77_019281 [Marasmius sp. AFHP31]|nr:hypothetical protein PQX77_019281 [Marasmius sp. AFHP31]